MFNSSLAERFARAAGEPFINRRMRDAVTPLSARHPAAARKAVARQAQTFDAKRFAVLHQQVENDRMQVQVQVSVDVVQGQAGGTEFFKLRPDFSAKLRAQAALEKINHAGSGWVVRKFAAGVDQPRNF